MSKTHNIEQLRSYCIRQDDRLITPFFYDGISHTKRFQNRSFKRLKRAYVDSRYSEHYEITEEELNWLAAEVEKLKILTESVCQGKIASLEGEEI